MTDAKSKVAAKIETVQNLALSRHLFLNLFAKICNCTKTVNIYIFLKFVLSFSAYLDQSHGAAVLAR